MSKRRVPPRQSEPRPVPFAEGQAQDAEPLSHALYFIEAALLELEQSVERLRRAPR